MIEYVTADDIAEAHSALIARTGGSAGLRDRGALESSAAQPMMTFGGQELYATLEEKAAALAFSLINNHPFVDGNKRVGHAAMATFLRLNGHRIVATLDEQEKLILGVASGQIDRNELTAWVRQHIERCPTS